MGRNEPSIQLSKTVAYLLRHNPAAAGLELDPSGWIDVEELLERMNAAGHRITADQLDAIINRSDKRRYEIRDGLIRAAQGHSVPGDLDLAPTTPPAQLFHGTVERFLASILDQGLLSGSRTHVHLSSDTDTARVVGARRGTPVILTVDAQRMQLDGHEFYLAANGVWLVQHVPVEYLTV
ncbi:RNA 2'-phosphotransferase [Euzebya tangerina]|uniref:RNA 2'-phosphotransferase n=1 Tax=Euzebya tangerina TaxID=591198 RepID=UPI000E31E2FA|nr:RNA 2'-phosphotransferase [Euzebya tangerina]